MVRGVLLLCVGVGVTLVTLLTAPPGGAFIVAYGAILAGVVNMAIGLSMPKRRPTADELDRLVGRDGPFDGRAQLAGAACARCGERIVSALEGIACGQCDRPLHRGCRVAHRADAHRVTARVAG
jgi:hypothetical protein